MCVRCEPTVARVPPKHLKMSTHPISWVQLQYLSPVSSCSFDKMRVKFAGWARDHRCEAQEGRSCSWDNPLDPKVICTACPNAWMHTLVFVLILSSCCLHSFEQSDLGHCWSIWNSVYILPVCQCVSVSGQWCGGDWFASASIVKYIISFAADITRTNEHNLVEWWSAWVAWYVSW